MSTGIESWDGNMLDLGPLYPFVGSEGIMVIIAVVFWVGWHILQIRMENRTHDETAARLRQAGNLQKAVEAEQPVERF
jgi:hypothetical protein